MTGLWSDQSGPLGDWAALVLPLAVPVVIGLILARGFAPWPLVRALLWRFRWANLFFGLLIAISVGLGVGLIAQERALRTGAASAADRFEMLVAAPGSDVTVMLASVFLEPTALPLLDGETFNAIHDNPRVTLAAPLAFGDSWQGDPVVGTTRAFVDHLGGGPPEEGRHFETSSEGVAGAALDLALGQVIVPAHGHGDEADPDAHDAEVTIVGRMAATGSPWDRAILVPVEQVWEVHGLANGHPVDAPPRIGPPFEARLFPGTPAIIVVTPDPVSAWAVRAEFDRTRETMAFFPGQVLNRLYGLMGDIRQAVSLMLVVSQALVAASVLLSLFILSRLFVRQLALLRALGAPARFVLAVVWGYGTLLIAGGTLAGIALGYGAAQVLSDVIGARTDMVLVARVGWSELHLLAAFLAVTSILALLPAWAALRQPVVAGLRA